jgi:metallopeptidase MepB
MAFLQTKIPPHPPLRFDITPADIELGATSLCGKTASLIDSLVRREDGHYTFTNTILPFIEAENARLRTFRWLNFFNSTNPDPDLRNASNKASKLLTDAELDIFMRADFYKAVSLVRDRSEKLDPEYEIYLKRLSEVFEQNGLNISGNAEAINRFAAIQKRLTSVKMEAFKNLNGDSTGLWLSINELQGLPPSFFEKRITRERKQEPAISGTVSEVWVSIKESDSLPVMKFAIQAESRKKMFIAKEHRCERNIPLYREIFILRDEAARLLGFEHHAAFRIHYKMAGTPGYVLKFLDDVEARLKDRRDDEIKAMLQLKHKDVQSTNAKTNQLFLWDKTFYDRINKENKCSFDQTLVTEYFSLTRSVEVMLRTFEHIFGIRIQAYKPSPGEVWHEDVSMYTIWDADDQDAFLGWLYIDPYPRDGKYTHFGHYSLQPVRVSLLRSLTKRSSI